MILKEAIEERQAADANALKAFGSGDEAPAEV